VTHATFTVQLTFEELGNLLIASVAADTAMFTKPAKGSLRRAQFKLRQAIPEHLRSELERAEQLSIERGVESRL